MMVGLLKYNKGEAAFTAGPETTFGEAVGAGRRAAWQGGTIAAGQRHSEAYGKWRPIFDRISQGYLDVPSDLKERLTRQGFTPDEETLGDLSSWVETEGQRYGYELTDDMRPETVIQRRDEINQAAEARVNAQQEVLSRASPFKRGAGALLGGLTAELGDPLNLATLPLGATARTGFLATVAIEAGINAGIEAVDTTSRNAIARQIGQEETDVLSNALFGAAFGGIFGGATKAIGMAAEPTTRLLTGGAQQVGAMLGREERRVMAEAAESSGDPVAQQAASAVRRDLEDEEAGSVDPEPEALLEHQTRLQEADSAAREGREPEMLERPVIAQPRPSVIAGEIEEVDPRELAVQPEVFQFKSDVVAEGGVTAKLKDVSRWMPERAGITLVFEYADGTRAVADGHQRTALAKRIMDQTGEEIRLAARVYREIEGFTAEDVRVLAALKNISEAADGMTTAMARDAAKVLRVDPEAIRELPAGPGIARAEALSRLSDEAFSMFINDVVPERFAELVGRMVDAPEMHGAIMKLLERTRPDTTAQAQSIIAQAMEAPVNREVTSDLFGDQEVVESLFLERAKVLERANKMMREDRAVFRTLDERADRIESTGANRLDAQTNKRTREQTEQALAAVQRLAHRAGPISEALNNGAKSYKETGRLKDAASGVVEAVRREIERNGLSGAGAGPSRQVAEPTRARTDAPDPAEGFADPVNGDAVQAQIDATRIDPARTSQVDVLADMEPLDAAKMEAELKEAQALASVDDLMQRGARNHDELTGEIAAAAQRAGVTARKAPLKGRERTEEKIRTKYAGNVNKVTDVARGGVDAPTPEAADAFVAALSRRYRVLDEGYKATDEGYFDRKLTVVFDDGQLGEVQIWPPGMFEAKELRGGHKLYEEYRLPETPADRKEELRLQMVELYSEVTAALDASWSRSGGGDAPNASSTAAASSGGTSVARSSASTSRAVSSEGSDQAEPLQTEATLRTSEAAASSDTSNRTSFMGGSSSDKVDTIPDGFKVEETSAGKQSVFDGIAPITQRDRAQARADAPIEGGRADDETQIGGLFDPDAPERFDLFDAVPVGRGFDADGNEVSLTKSRQELAAELDADDDAVEVLDICVKGSGA